MSHRISIFLRVKFRAGMFTLGTVERSWIIALPMSVPVPPRELFREDQHGVLISVALA